MAWTEITRRQYARRTARYASDMTDREWGLVRPFLPMPRRLGRPRTTDLREVVNALLYIATTGCQWRMLPKDFPPCSTVQRYFYEWRALGFWARKKTKGRKRHIIVDTLGLMVGLMVHSADIQDRDGAPDLLKSIRHRWPWLLHVFADGGYAGDKLKRRLKKIGRWTVEISKRSDKAKGFEVLPRRWVVERTFAWLGRCRRLAKDVERSIASAEAWIMIAHIRLITRRLARYGYR